MRNLFKNRPLLIAIVAVLLLIILALTSNSERTLTVVENVAGGIMQPALSFASRASASIVNFVRNAFNTTDADIENQQLKMQLAQMEQSVMELESLRKENDRLKSLLSFVELNPGMDVVSGTVIGRNAGVWFDTFTLNIGGTHGVEKNMPVTDGSGLIGRVHSVGATYCKVISIIDSSMSVSVMVDRTRDTGMARGLLEAGNDLDTLELYYLPTDADLVPGDKIVTSGVGGIYPKGLLVGEVREVSRGDGSERNATITPTVDFRHIEEVLVITGVPTAEAIP